MEYSRRSIRDQCTVYICWEYNYVFSGSERVFCILIILIESEIDSKIRFCSDVPIFPSSNSSLTDLIAGKITSVVKVNGFAPEFTQFRINDIAASPDALLRKLAYSSWALE